MFQSNKKTQIIKSYLDDILPYMDYNSVNDLKFKAHLRLGTTKRLEKNKIEQFIKYNIDDEFHLELDFKNSSIKDVYKGLNIINNSILAG